MAGGVANQGAVVRVGDTVRRPRGPHSGWVAALLLHLEEAGCTVTPRFLGYDDRGREVLSWVPGEVPLPPFPAWAMSDDALRSVAHLLRELHDATAGFRWQDRPGGWSTGLADPTVPSGPVVDRCPVDPGVPVDPEMVVCHDDVRPANVVFRDGRAVAVVDFDFAAPGRRVWDVVSTVAMWAPLDAPEWRRAHPPGLDAVARAATFADAYGLDHEARGSWFDVLRQRHEVGRAFVRRHVRAGEPAFVAMVEEFGADERWAATDRWLAAVAPAMTAALS